MADITPLEFVRNFLESGTPTTSRTFIEAIGQPELDALTVDDTISAGSNVANEDLELAGATTSTGNDLSDPDQVLNVGQADSRYLNSILGAPQQLTYWRKGTDVGSLEGSITFIEDSYVPPKVANTGTTAIDDLARIYVQDLHDGGDPRNYPLYNAALTNSNVYILDVLIRASGTGNQDSLSWFVGFGAAGDNPLDTATLFTAGAYGWGLVFTQSANSNDVGSCRLVASKADTSIVSTTPSAHDSLRAAGNQRPRRIILSETVNADGSVDLHCSIYETRSVKGQTAQLSPEFEANINLSSVDAATTSTITSEGRALAALMYAHAVDTSSASININSAQKMFH
jgi:hypothetical protein